MKKMKIKSITLINLMELWLKNKENLKIQSRQKYENIINIYLKDYFQNKLISKISSNDIKIYLKEVKNKNISVMTQRLIIYIIRASINYGYQNRYCNYLELSNIQIKNTPKIIYTLSLNEQKELEKKLMENINIRKCCLLLCLYTGLRVGEVCGLKWEDINFSAGTIQVKRTIQRIKNNSIGINDSKTILIESTPKSSTSNRLIPVPNFLIKILKNYKMDNDLYILSSSKKFYDPRLLESFYKRILTFTNIQNNKFHTLRHTFATRAIESKMDVKTLSEILGHANIDITLKLYVHPSLELKKQSIENLVNYISNTY